MSQYEEKYKQAKMEMKKTHEEYLRRQQHVSLLALVLLKSRLFLTKNFLSKMKQYEQEYKNLSSKCKSLEEKSNQYLQTIVSKDEKINSIIEELKSCHEKLKSNANEVKSTRKIRHIFWLVGGV